MAKRKIDAAALARMIQDIPEDERTEAGIASLIADALDPSVFERVDAKTQVKFYAVNGKVRTLLGSIAKNVPAKHLVSFTAAVQNELAKLSA